MRLIFLIIAIVLFLVDLILAIVSPNLAPWSAVLLYGGLAFFATSFLPFGGVNVVVPPNS